MKKKNLAVIGVGIVGTGNRGGIPAFVEALEGLSKDYNVTVYSFIPVDSNRAPSSLRVRCVPSQKIPMRIRYAYLALFFIVDHVRRPFHLIHAQSPIPAGVMAHYMKWLLGVPYVLSFHATEAAYMPEQSIGDLLNDKIRLRSRAIIPYADLVTTFSTQQADDVRENLQYERNIIVLPRGIRVPKVLASKIITTPLRIVHVSYYQPVKDHVTLLKAFAEISKTVDCKLTIIGENYGDDFFEMVKRFAPGARIEVLGPLPRAKIIEVFNDAHILMHSSVYEGLPMVALEAMAHGVVVCGTNVGVIADFSGDRCLSVPTGNYDDLAEAVLSLTRDPEQYQRLRSQAHAWLLTHDMDWYLEQMKDLYTNVIKRNAN